MRKLVFMLVALAVSRAMYAAPTYPILAEKAASPELGEAVLLLMPNKKAESIGWGHQANGTIVWITEGFKTENWANGDTVTTREGFLRVHVLGQFAHVLKQRKNVLAWTVRYSTKSNPKFGVETISLFPGSSDDVCFGTLFDGCRFEILPSLKKAGLSTTKICELKKSQQRIVAYQVVYPKKRETNVILSESWGSGGSSSSVEMNIAVPSASLCQ